VNDSAVGIANKNGIRRMFEEQFEQGLLVSRRKFLRESVHLG
jgi:hypothetical protein